MRPIYRTGVPLPSRCCILYIFSTNISTEYFKNAAHSPFFSSKCRLFHNATFLFPVLFTFYIQEVLKFKCKTPVPKGLFYEHTVTFLNLFRKYPEGLKSLSDKLEVCDRVSAVGPNKFSRKILLRRNTEWN